MRRLLAVLVALAISGSGALAQSPRVEIVLPASGELATTPPSVRTVDVLISGRTAELVRNGFPARLHYKLERWTAGTFVNDVKATVEWETIAEYDALAKSYRLVLATSQGAKVLGDFADIKSANAALADPYVTQIALPKRGDKSYYAITLTVEAMSMSDLDEVQRWLRGELRPAVRGKKNPGTAVGTGVRTLFVRLLGGERVVYQSSTGVFRP